MSNAASWSICDHPHRWTVLDPSLKKGNWTEEEDALILAGVAEHGRDWVTIAETLPGRTSNTILQRYAYLNKRVKNPWTDDEDSRLTSAVSNHGTRDWKAVAEGMENRTADECSSRWWQWLSKLKITSSSLAEWDTEVCSLSQLSRPFFTIFPGGRPSGCRGEGAWH